MLLFFILGLFLQLMKDEVKLRPCKLGVVVHAVVPATHEAEAGGSQF
jgi:hypothetical protein